MSDSQHDQKTKTEQLRGKLLAAWDKTRAQSQRAWEKTKAAAMVGWSRSRVFLGKARVAVAKHPVSPLLYVTVLSVAIPKHTVLAWIAPVLLSCHYYSRKLTATALAVLLSEVDARGDEYQRGMKTYVLPAHNGPGCRDVLVRCIRFVLPEALDVSGGGPDAMCEDRKLRVRLIAHSIDTDFACCCQASVTLS